MERQERDCAIEFLSVLANFYKCSIDCLIGPQPGSGSGLINARGRAFTTRLRLPAYTVISTNLQLFA